MSKLRSGHSHKNGCQFGATCNTYVAHTQHLYTRYSIHISLYCLAIMCLVSNNHSSFWQIETVKLWITQPMAELATLEEQRLDKQLPTVVIQATTWWEVPVASVNFIKNGLSVNQPVNVCYLCPTSVHVHSRPILSICLCKLTVFNTTVLWYWHIRIRISM